MKITGTNRGPHYQSELKFRVLFGLAAIFSFVSGSILLRWLDDEFQGRGTRHVLRAGPSLQTTNVTVLKPTRVAFFLDGFDAETNRMKQGGAGGEIRLFNDFMHSIRSNSKFELQLITAVDDNTKDTLQGVNLIVSDQYRLASLLAVIPDALSNPEIACKLRFIDFWGTPPEQNHIHLHLQQFLVPYPNPWNEFLGFRQDIIASANVVSEPPIVLLHGKVGQYFQNHLHVISALTESYQVVATVPLSQLDGLQFPTRVVNVGICNSTEWRRMLSKSSIVIGFGDPVLAPTALEAIAAGSPYIFAKYSQPRSLVDLPAHPIRSQHDFMMGIGPPYAYAINVDDVDVVLETVQLAIRNGIGSWIPAPYKAMQHLERVENILQRTLCRNPSQTEVAK